MTAAISMTFSSCGRLRHGAALHEFQMQQQEERLQAP
jgi:hypothetical protein